LTSSCSPYPEKNNHEIISKSISKGVSDISERESGFLQRIQLSLSKNWLLDEMEVHDTKYQKVGIIL
jgi:hypothetical protein